MARNYAEMALNEELDYSTKEAYNTLRTNLKFCGENLQTILITSCTEGEGKSTTSMNLAKSFADEGKKVLLIDTDLRKSVTVGTNKMRTENGQMYGLSHYLSGQCEIEEIVYDLNVKNMSIIVAGPASPNPTQLLGGERFKNLLEYAKYYYDYVIIDSAPLMPVIDTMLIAPQCDGTILVIESEAVRYKYAQDVIKQLQFADCKILGAILNKEDNTRKKSYGKYYKGYY